MVAVLFNAGDHVPVIPLVDVVGNELNVAPEQMGATARNTGTIFGLTVIVIVAGTAHSPAAGVNVYKVVAVLFNAGDHVPVMPLFEVVGNGLSVAPEQIAATWVKVGGMGVVINTLIVVSIAHCPGVCVNV